MQALSERQLLAVVREAYLEAPGPWAASADLTPAPYTQPDPGAYDKYTYVASEGTYTRNLIACSDSYDLVHLSI